MRGDEMSGKMYSAIMIAEMYGVTPKTAREYMKQMGCEKKPYRVSEEALRKWKKKRYCPPVDYQKASDEFQAMLKKMEIRFGRKEQGE